MTIIIQLILAVVTAVSQGSTTFAPASPSASIWDARPGSFILQYTGTDRYYCGPINDEACLVVVAPDLTIEILRP